MKKTPYSPPTVKTLTPDQARQFIADRKNCTEEEAAEFVESLQRSREVLVSLHTRENDFQVAQAQTAEETAQKRNSRRSPARTTRPESPATENRRFCSASRFSHRNWSRIPPRNCRLNKAIDNVVMSERCLRHRAKCIFGAPVFLFIRDV